MKKSLTAILLGLGAVLGAGMAESPSADDYLEARDDSYRTEVNLPLTVEPPGVIANDRSAEGAVVVLVEPPPNGRLALLPDGSFTYTAEPDFSGTVRFSYRLADGLRESNAASVTITVPEVSQEPARAATSVEPLAVSGPALRSITDFSETVEGTTLRWEKAYFQDRDIDGAETLEIPFGLNRPPGYDPAERIRYPLVVYMHGAGARRDWTLSHSNPDQRDHSLVDAALRRPTARFFARASQTQAPYRAFVLAPQVPSTSALWVGSGPDIPYVQTDTPNLTYSEYLHLLENLLDFLTDGARNAVLESELGLDAGDIDSERIYVVGDSDGAKGTWDILARRPAFFARGIAASGTGPRNRLDELRRTPLWTIHGRLDPVVPNELPSQDLPRGSGTLGMLVLLDPDFDNTGSTPAIYKDDPTATGDDPPPSEALIYSEFGETFTHSAVAITWSGMTSGTLPWLFAQAGSVNSPPVAQDQSVSTDEDTPVAITLRASDPDGDHLAYAIATSPSHGALSGIAPQVTFTPASGFAGTDTFTFRADDGAAQGNLATVTVRVRASITVPDVVGRSRTDAVAAITAAGLSAGSIDTQQSATAPTDTVLSQNPAGGVEVAEGTAVDLLVSVAPDTFTLTVVSDGAGSGSVGGGGVFPAGTVVTPVASADAGSLFAGWSPAYCGGSFALTGDTVCTATFVKDLVAAADGDVAPLGNRDGEVTVMDALLTLKFALGTATPSAEDIIHADVAPLGTDGRPDPDGEITAADALVILRKAVGLVVW